MTKTWYCDFETTTDAWSETETRMAVWGMTDNYHKFQWGVTWQSFFDTLINHKRANTEAYFLNLSFDGEFILHLLNRTGWTQQLSYTWSPYSWKVMPQHRDKIQHKKYTLIYTELGKLMSIKVNYKGHIIHFRDAMLIFPYSIARINDLVAKAHNLTLKKGSFDFTKIRPYKSKKDVPWELVEYLRDDVRGLPYIFKDFQEELRALSSKGSLKLTIGATTKAIYMKFIQEWKLYFGCDMSEWDSELRPGYYGGLTLVNPRYQNKTIEQDIYKYDINSSYPHQMRNKLMPYGLPKIIDEVDIDEFTPKPDKRYLFKVSVTKCEKVDKFMPSHLWDLDKRNSRTETYTDGFDVGADGDGYIYIFTYVEFLEILKTYKMEYQVLRIFEFHAKLGIFDKVIDTFFEEKVKNKLAGKDLMKEIYKLLINNGYGKFGENNVKNSRIQVKQSDIDKLTDEQLRMTSILSSSVDYGNPNYVWTRGRTETDEFAYLPVAMFTTSDARVQLLQAIRDQTRDGDNFLYCDTDSIVILGKAKNIALHSYKLGYWDLEAHITKFKVIKPKCYMYDSEMVTYKKIAGFPEKGRGVITWDNFNAGQVFLNAKKQKKRVKGGLLLMPTKVTL